MPLFTVENMKKSAVQVWTIGWVLHQHGLGDNLGDSCGVAAAVVYVKMPPILHH